MEPMDAAALVSAIQAAIPGVEIQSAPGVDLQTTVYVAAGDVPAVARALRDTPSLAFAVLAEITAVGFWPREPRYELVYMLVSIANRLRLRMKVRLPGDAPGIETVTVIWPAANWLEREVWD